MKRFKVQVDVKATETYYVTAKDEDEALKKVRNGDYDEDEYSIDIHSSYWDFADIYEEK